MNSVNKSLGSMKADKALEKMMTTLYHHGTDVYHVDYSLVPV
jgi:hypothetical protein